MSFVVLRTLLGQDVTFPIAAISPMECRSPLECRSLRALSKHAGAKSPMCLNGHVAWKWCHCLRQLGTNRTAASQRPMSACCSFRALARVFSTRSGYHCRWHRHRGLTSLDKRMGSPKRNGLKIVLGRHLFRQAGWRLASGRDALSIHCATPHAKHR